MPAILLTGVRSKIIQELKPLLPCAPRELTREQCEMSSVGSVDSYRDLIAASNRIVLAHGTISGKAFLERVGNNIEASLNCNLLSMVRVCEIALANNPNVRIVVIGSESARKGSFDLAYSLAKAGLEAYVTNRRLEHPGQQLMCVSPSMIEDSGMAAQKTEAEISAAKTATPKGRGLTASEVARMIHYLLYVDEGYTTNTVIRMDGGKFAGKG